MEPHLSNTRGWNQGGSGRNLTNADASHQPRLPSALPQTYSSDPNYQYGYPSLPQAIPREIPLTSRASYPPNTPSINLMQTPSQSPIHGSLYYPSDDKYYPLRASPRQYSHPQLSITSVPSPSNSNLGGRNLSQHPYIPTHARPPDVSQVKDERDILSSSPYTRSLELTRVGPPHTLSSISSQEDNPILITSRPNTAVHPTASSSQRSNYRPSAENIYQDRSQPHLYPSQSHSMNNAASHQVPRHHPHSSQNISKFSSQGRPPPTLIKAEEPTTLSAAHLMTQLHPRSSYSNDSGLSTPHHKFETATAPVPYAVAKQAEDPYFAQKLKESFACIRKVENPYATGKLLIAPSESTPNQSYSTGEVQIHRQKNEMYTATQELVNNPYLRNFSQPNGDKEGLGQRDKPSKTSVSQPHQQSNTKDEFALDLSVKTVRQLADSTEREPDIIEIRSSSSSCVGTSGSNSPNSTTRRYTPLHNVANQENYKSSLYQSQSGIPLMGGPQFAQIAHDINGIPSSSRHLSSKRSADSAAPWEQLSKFQKIDHHQTASGTKSHSGIPSDSQNEVNRSHHSLYTELGKGSDSHKLSVKSEPVDHGISDHSNNYDPRFHGDLSRHWSYSYDPQIHNPNADSFSHQRPHTDADSDASRSLAASSHSPYQKTEHHVSYPPHSAEQFSSHPYTTKKLPGEMEVSNNASKIQDKPELYNSPNKNLVMLNSKVSSDTDKFSENSEAFLIRNTSALKESVSNSMQVSPKLKSLDREINISDELQSLTKASHCISDKFKKAFDLSSLNKKLDQKNISSDAIQESVDVRQKKTVLASSLDTSFDSIQSKAKEYSSSGKELTPHDEVKCVDTEKPCSNPESQKILTGQDRNPLQKDFSNSVNIDDVVNKTPSSTQENEPNSCEKSEHTTLQELPNEAEFNNEIKDIKTNENIEITSKVEKATKENQPYQSTSSKDVSEQPKTSDASEINFNSSITKEENSNISEGFISENKIELSIPDTPKTQSESESEVDKNKKDKILDQSAILISKHVECNIENESSSATTDRSSQNIPNRKETDNDDKKCDTEMKTDADSTKVYNVLMKENYDIKSSLDIENKPVPKKREELDIEKSINQENKTLDSKNNCEKDTMVDSSLSVKEVHKYGDKQASISSTSESVTEGTDYKNNESMPDKVPSSPKLSPVPLDEKDSLINDERNKDVSDPKILQKMVHDQPEYGPLSTESQNNISKSDIVFDITVENNLESKVFTENKTETKKSISNTGEKEVEHKVFSDETKKAELELITLPRSLTDDIVISDVSSEKTVQDGSKVLESTLRAEAVKTPNQEYDKADINKCVSNPTMDMNIRTVKECEQMHTSETSTNTTKIRSTSSLMDAQESSQLSDKVDNKISLKPHENLTQSNCKESSLQLLDKSIKELNDDTSKSELDKDKVKIETKIEVDMKDEKLGEQDQFIQDSKKHSIIKQSENVITAETQQKISDVADISNTKVEFKPIVIPGDRSLHSTSSPNIFKERLLQQAGHIYANEVPLRKEAKREVPDKVSDNNRTLSNPIKKENSSSSKKEFENRVDNIVHSAEPSIAQSSNFNINPPRRENEVLAAGSITQNCTVMTQENLLRKETQNFRLLNQKIPGSSQIIHNIPRDFKNNIASCIMRAEDPVLIENRNMSDDLVDFSKNLIPSNKIKEDYDNMPELLPLPKASLCPPRHQRVSQSVPHGLSFPDEELVIEQRLNPNYVSSKPVSEHLKTKGLSQTGLIMGGHTALPSKSHPYDPPLSTPLAISSLPPPPSHQDPYLASRSPFVTRPLSVPPQNYPHPAAAASQIYSRPTATPQIYSHPTAPPVNHQHHYPTSTTESTPTKPIVSRVTHSPHSPTHPPPQVLGQKPYYGESSHYLYHQYRHSQPIDNNMTASPPTAATQSVSLSSKSFSSQHKDRTPSDTVSPFGMYNELTQKSGSVQVHGSHKETHPKYSGHLPSPTNPHSHYSLSTVNTAMNEAHRLSIFDSYPSTSQASYPHQKYAQQQTNTVKPPPSHHPYPPHVTSIYSPDQEYYKQLKKHPSMKESPTSHQQPPHHSQSIHASQYPMVSSHDPYHMQPYNLYSQYPTSSKAYPHSSYAVSTQSTSISIKTSPSVGATSSHPSVVSSSSTSYSDISRHQPAHRYQSHSSQPFDKESQQRNKNFLYDANVKLTHSTNPYDPKSYGPNYQNIGSQIVPNQEYPNNYASHSQALSHKASHSNTQPVSKYPSPSPSRDLVKAHTVSPINLSSQIHRNTPDNSKSNSNIPRPPSHSHQTPSSGIHSAFSSASGPYPYTTMSHGLPSVSHPSKQPAPSQHSSKSLLMNNLGGYNDSRASPIYRTKSPVTLGHASKSPVNAPQFNSKLPASITSYPCSANPALYSPHSASSPLPSPYASKSPHQFASHSKSPIAVDHSSRYPVTNAPHLHHPKTPVSTVSIYEASSPSMNANVFDHSANLKPDRNLGSYQHYKYKYLNHPHNDPQLDKSMTKSNSIESLKYNKTEGQKTYPGSNLTDSYKHHHPISDVSNSLLRVEDKLDCKPSQHYPLHNTTSTNPPSQLGHHSISYGHQNPPSAHQSQPSSHQYPSAHPPQIRQPHPQSSHHHSTIPATYHVPPSSYPQATPPSKHQVPINYQSGPSHRQLSRSQRQASPFTPATRSYPHPQTTTHAVYSQTSVSCTQSQARPLEYANQYTSCPITTVSQPHNAHLQASNQPAHVAYPKQMAYNDVKNPYAQTRMKHPSYAPTINSHVAHSQNESYPVSQAPHSYSHPYPDQPPIRPKQPHQGSHSYSPGFCSTASFSTGQHRIPSPYSQKDLSSSYKNLPNDNLKLSGNTYPNQEYVVKESSVSKSLMTSDSGKIALAEKLLQKKQIKTEVPEKLLEEDKQCVKVTHSKAKLTDEQDLDMKFDKLLDDLELHKDVVTSKKSRVLGRRYNQKLQLQSAVDNDEIIEPDTYMEEEESEESEREEPIKKFRGKFKSIKDKAVERVILTYASHSDESATEMIPDEDASDFEEELIKEIEAKSRKSKRGGGGGGGSRGMTKLREIEKRESSDEDNRKKEKLSVSKKKTPVRETQKPTLKDDSASSYSYSSSHSSSSSNEDSNSDSTASSSDREISSKRTNKNHRRVLRRRAHSSSSNSEEEDFIPKRKTRRSKKFSSDEEFSPSLGRRRAKRKRKEDSSDECSDNKTPSFTKNKKENIRSRKDSRKLAKNKNDRKINLRSLALSESDEENEKTISKSKLQTKRKFISDSEGNDDSPSPQKNKLKKNKSGSTQDVNMGMPQKATGDMPSTIKEETYEEKDKDMLPKIKEEVLSLLRNDEILLRYSKDSVIVKLNKLRIEESNREDVLEMKKWKMIVDSEMSKLLTQLFDAKWKHSWKKPLFGNGGNEFKKGWQSDFKQFKMNTARIPRPLVSTPTPPAQCSLSLNEDSKKGLSSPKKGAKDGSKSSLKVKVKGTKGKSGIVKTSLTVSENKDDFKVAARPEISNVMEKFFEKILGRSNLDDSKKFPPFGPFTPPTRSPTGLTPTPSLSFNISDDSDKDSINSYRRNHAASDSVPVRPRRASIATVLMKKLKQKYKDRKLDTHWLGKSRAILEPNNKPQLLPTPGLSSNTSQNPDLPSNYDSIKFTTFFRKDSVTRYRETFEEVVQNSGINEFTPLIAPSRTRKTSKAILDLATIIAVFGGEPLVATPKKETPKTNSSKKKSGPGKDGDRLKESILTQSPVPSIVSQSSSTPVDFLFNDDDDSEIRSERSADSRLQDFVLMPGIHKSKRKLRKMRKFRSGFDYIRKKKKVKQEDDAIPTSKRKITVRKRVLWPEENREVASEIRAWVINKGLGETILHKAARLQYHDVVMHCLESFDFNVNAKDNAGYTPLHEACNRGHLDIAQALCAHQAHLNAAGFGGMRPLHEALENGHIELARLLLAYGADPSLLTYGGQSCAALSGDTQTEKFIEEFLADLKGKKALPWHIRGPARIFDLSEQGSDIFAGIPPLHLRPPPPPPPPPLPPPLPPLPTSSSQLKNSKSKLSETDKMNLDLGSQTSEETRLDSKIREPDSGFHSRVDTKIREPDSGFHSPDLTFESCDKLLPDVYIVSGKDGRYYILNDFLNYVSMSFTELIKATGSLETLRLTPEEVNKKLRSAVLGYPFAVSECTTGSLVLLKETKTLKNLIQIEVTIMGTDDPE